MAYLVFGAAPLPFGSVDGVWIAVWCVVLSTSLLLSPGDEFALPYRSTVVPIIVIVTLLAAAVGAQSWPSPPLLKPDESWAFLGLLDGSPPSPIASASRTRQWEALGAPILFALAFARAFFLAGDSRRARVLLLAIAVSGATIALAAIVLLLLNLAPNFGRASILYRNNLTGPFINRNVAATYWGTCSLIWLVLLMQIMTEHLRGTQGWRSLLFRITAKAPLRAVASALGFLVCSGATAMTGSRAGLLITATLSMAIPPVWLYRHSLLRSGWIVPAIALVVLGIILQIAGGAVSQRIDVAGLSDDFRFQTYLATLTMIADHPWLGIGLGSFETVFPSYRTAALGSFGVWDHAHNSLLELTAELGIPIGVIVLLTALYFGACLVRGVLTRRRDLIFPLAGLVVGLLGCLHSMVDFPLQQPGYAVVFAAVVACGLAQCDRRSAPARSEPLALH